MEALQNSLNNVKNRVIAKPMEEIQQKSKYYPVLLNCSTYALNKSRSKFISVGLSSYGVFAPIVVLHGLKNDFITFEEADWKLLLENQGVITNFVYTDEGQQQMVNIGTKIACFHTIGKTRVVTFRDTSGFEICMAFESICELWDFLPIIENRTKILKDLQFYEFYIRLVKGIAAMPIDYKTAVQAVLKDLHASANVVCMQEMIRFAPHIVAGDVEIEACAQLLNNSRD